MQRVPMSIGHDSLKIEGHMKLHETLEIFAKIS